MTTTPNSALAILLTSHVDLDAENILRCLDAGIETVLAVVPEVEDVLSIRVVSEKLGARQGSVIFCSHDVAKSWLKRHTAAIRGATTVKYCRGYRVVSIYPPRSPETERRERDALQVIATLLMGEPGGES